MWMTSLTETQMKGHAEHDVIWQNLLKKMWEVSITTRQPCIAQNAIQQGSSYIPALHVLTK
jgi:hypothetical protein